MKNRLILFVTVLMACFFCVQDLAAQEINITGKLIDSEGIPISQVHVSLVLAGIETQSNADGSFTLYQDNTGIGDPNTDEIKLSFDGRSLYLACKGDEVNVGIFDLSGREVANIISKQVLSGNFTLYPGAYIDYKNQSVLIIRASVGQEHLAFRFIPDGLSSESRGLSEISARGSNKKSSDARFSSIDTLVIEHDQYVGKKIPIDCHICSFGDIIVFEKVPIAPTNLSGNSESSSTITLNWSDNSNNESGFRIERATFQVLEGWADFSDLAEVLPDVTGYTDEGLIQGRSYKYRVLAYNNGGSSRFSEETTITTQLSNPLTISGPATSTGNFDIVVSYSWPGLLGSTSDRFELEESTSPTSGFTKIANSPWGERPQSYTFSLSKPSGTYYYRARANKVGFFTDYTDVISVSVNTPVQKAYLKVVNNTHYPMIDIRLNNQQMVGQDLGVLPGDSYTFEFSSSGQVNYALGVGYWEYSSRNVWFYYSGSTQVTVGTTTTITFNNPTIAQLLSGFSQYRDWTGEYWVDLNMYMAGFRFYSNGTWKLYDNGVQIDSGTVSLTSWPDNASIVKFKLCTGCDEILLAYPFGQFTYRNGPPSWPLIKYTAQ